MKPTLSRPVRAVAYIRVSTDEQVESGVSMDGQRSEIGTYCNRHGLDLAQVYQDEGWSATDPKRPGLLRMMADLKDAHERGERVTLVIWKFDRIWRLQRLFLECMEQMQKWGFGFVSITEEVDTTTSMGHFMASIMGSVNELFVKQIRERTRMGLAQVKREGRRVGQQFTYGFRCVQGRGLMVIPQEIAVIETILGWYYLDKMSPTEILKLIEVRQMAVPRTIRWVRRLVHEKPFYLAVVSPQIRAAAKGMGREAPVFPAGYFEPYNPEAFSGLTEKARERAIGEFSIV